MKCPRCAQENTKVLESRLSHEGRAVRRRRSCLDCNYRYTTYEKEEELVFQIRKKDGKVEPYSRIKSLKGLQIAFQKRPINLSDIELLLTNVERKIQAEGERIVDSRKLGDLIMEDLREIDDVAYVRFASVYRDFKDPEQFIAELKKLRDPDVTLDHSEGRPQKAD